MLTGRVLLSVLFIGVNWFLVACGAPAQPTAVPSPIPTVDLLATETSIAAKIFATQTADAPTITPTLTATNTALPSPTAKSTSTPRPTATLVVAQTPTSTASTVVTSTLASGWIRYEHPSGNFAVALPSSWRMIDTSPDAIASGLETVGDLNPKFKAMFSSEAVRNLVANGIKFYALDTTPESFSGGLPVTANVISYDMKVDLPMETVVAATLQQLKQFADPETPISHRTLHLKNIDAEEFTYATQVRDITGNPVPVTLRQYLVVDGTLQYVLSLSTPTALASTYLPLYDQVGPSFELLDVNQ